VFSQDRWGFDYPTNSMKNTDQTCIVQCRLDHRTKPYVLPFTTLSVSFQHCYDFN